MNKSYKCRCGKVHEFSAWVFAHWREIVTHKCECGLVATICMGEVFKFKKPRKAKAEKARP